MFERTSLSITRDTFLAPWSIQKSERRGDEEVDNTIILPIQSNESVIAPYVKRKFKNTPKKINVNNLKQDLYDPFRSEFISRSIDIEHLKKKLGNVKMLPKINVKSRMSTIENTSKNLKVLNNYEKDMRF